MGRSLWVQLHNSWVTSLIGIFGDTYSNPNYTGIEGDFFQLPVENLYQPWNLEANPGCFTAQVVLFPGKAFVYKVIMNTGAENYARENSTAR